MDETQSFPSVHASSPYRFVPFLLVGSLAATSVPAVRAAEPIRYEIRFDHADHHEAEVEATFRGIDAGPLELRMSRSSPGRYALHEFAKNVYRFEATDGRGRPLEVTRPDPYGWTVRGHDGTVVARYTVFGDRCDGTYLAVDNTHAHLNMPATFVFARATATRPIELTVIPPKAGWKVATQLGGTDRSNVFTAPNLDYFFDSPLEIGPLALFEWTSTWSGGTRSFRLALHHRGTDAEGKIYARLAQAVVEEEKGIWGELADYDFGSYTFIADYLPDASGDGMEHRNSTVMTSRRDIADPIPNLGTVAHEFFHSWNVERLRPRSLEPFDFERANMSGELWFAEGFTSYYDALVMKRAGITSVDRYAEAIGGLLDVVVNAPGRSIFSPVEMSCEAPFVDAAVSIDPTNRENTYVSYYPYGAVLALGLDLSIRERFSGKSLDDFMREAWRRHGKTEIPYELQDLEVALAAVTDADFARQYFDGFIRKGDLPDYERLLALAGFELRRPDSDKAWLGAEVAREKAGARIRTRPRVGSPLYEAGADLGDLLLELDGRSLAASDGGNGVDEVLAGLEPGKRAKIVLDKRGERREVELVPQADPTIEVVPFERAGRALADASRAFRESWLGSRSGSARVSLPRKRCEQCGREYPFEMEFCAYDGKRLGIRNP
jgi:predicted metalloprotease with PDZ domain